MQDLKLQGVNLRLTSAVIVDMRTRCQGDARKIQGFEAELLADVWIWLANLRIYPQHQHNVPLLKFDGMGKD